MFDLILSFVKKSIFLFLAICFVIKVPEYHKRILRQYVGKRVVMLTTKDGHSGGTGFQVHTSHGKDVVLTNRHVCKIQDEEGYVYASDDYGFHARLKVLKISDFTDLCVIEGLPHLKGLSLASGDNYAGELVYTLGHPKLQPLVLQEGEVYAHQDVSILDHLMSPKDDPKSCSGEIKEIDFFGFKIPLCVVVVKAELTTLIIFGGNSGSPVFDDLGHIEGVVFAADTETNQGCIIPLADVRKFLVEF